VSVRQSLDDAEAAPDARGSRRRSRRTSWARRRHLGLITTGVALLVLVVGLVAVVLTWDNGRTPLSQRAAVAPTSAAPTLSASGTGSAAATPTSAPGPISLRATITAIGDSQWTATGRTGLVYTVVVDSGTQFPGKRTFDTYAVGDSIAIQGTLDAGVITATVIGANR
jgi:hypothetical protein